ncbi:MAG: SMP-30/gluconolactonase/LRE family protein [Mycobacteriales bacterium]
MARKRLDELATVGEMSLDHPEGVAVTPDGTLYAGGEAGQIYRVDLADGQVRQVAAAGGFLLGLAADGDGFLYACNPGLGLVQRIDPGSGGVSTWSAGATGRVLCNPNMPVFDEAGNLYVSDSGTFHGADGCILLVDPGGATTVWCEESRDFPNGMCLAGNALLVVESVPPALVRIPIRPDGGPGRREVVAELPGTVPDGVALAADGSAFVFCYRPDRILRVGTDGTVAIVADDPEGTVLAAPTNGVWLDGRLVVANLGRWHLTVFDPGVGGAPLCYPKLADR